MKKRHFLIVTIPILIYSCRPPLYFPNSANVPLLKKKGDFNLSIGSGTSGFQLQGAVATGNHIAVVGDIMSQSSDDKSSYTTYSSSNGSTSNNTNSYSSGHEQFLGEIGAGYFSAFGKHGVAECFGGVGFGSASSYGGSTHVSGDITKLFMQMDVGTKGNIAELAFTTRFAYLSLGFNQTRSYSYNDAPLNSIYGFVFEPALTLKVGYKSVKAFAQFGLSYSSDQHLRNENEGGWFTAGLSLGFE